MVDFPLPIMPTRNKLVPCSPSATSAAVFCSHGNHHSGQAEARFPNTPHREPRIVEGSKRLKRARELPAQTLAMHPCLTSIFFVKSA
jgi:hypothetical protein